MTLRDLMRRLHLPPAPDRRAPTLERIAELARAHAWRGGRLLDLGCGALRLEGCLARMDYEATAAANVRGDAHDLPFADGAFSLVVCKAVLEHVSDFRRAIAEIARVLQPGGEIWVEVPWFYPFHPSDAGERHDYVRLSHTAYDVEFAAFERIAFGPALGVGTTLSLALPEYFALFVSMRDHTALYHNARNLLTWAFYPLRWTDALLARRRFHERIAGGFYFRGRKRAAPAGSGPR